MTKDEVLYAAADLGCYDVVATYSAAWRDPAFAKYGYGYGLVCNLPDQQIYKCGSRWSRSEAEFYAENGQWILDSLRDAVEKHPAESLAA